MPSQLPPLEIPATHMHLAFLDRIAWLFGSIDVAIRERYVLIGTFGSIVFVHREFHIVFVLGLGVSTVTILLKFLASAAVLFVFPHSGFACFGMTYDDLLFRTLSPAQENEPFVARVKVVRESYDVSETEKSSTNPELTVVLAATTFRGNHFIDIVVTEAISGFSEAEQVTMRASSICQFLPDLKIGMEGYISGRRDGRFFISTSGIGLTRETVRRKTKYLSREPLDQERFEY